MKTSTFFACDRNQLILKLNETVPGSEVRLSEIFGKILCELDAAVTFDRLHIEDEDESICEAVVVKKEEKYAK